ncbi:hypothetical protein B0H11DRAFT_528426 [Mycena galericulata]|nr:hypothetical protein B0H11DRAFT_528426 [Mycena galericulata]
MLMHSPCKPLILTAVVPTTSLFSVCIGPVNDHIVSPRILWMRLRLRIWRTTRTSRRQRTVVPTPSTSIPASTNPLDCTNSFKAIVRHPCMLFLPLCLPDPDHLRRFSRPIDVSAGSIPQRDDIPMPHLGQVGIDWNTSSFLLTCSCGCGTEGSRYVGTPARARGTGGALVGCGQSAGAVDKRITVVRPTRSTYVPPFFISLDPVGSNMA